MSIVGIDRAKCKHDYLLPGPTGQILRRGRRPHNTARLQELAATIWHHAGSDCSIRARIEMNCGSPTGPADREGMVIGEQNGPTSRG